MRTAFNEETSPKNLLHLLANTTVTSFRCFTREEFGCDVWHDTTLGYDNMAKEFVQLFVIADGELQMTRHNTLLLVIAGSVTGEFENLGGEVF